MHREGLSSEPDLYIPFQQLETHHRGRGTALESVPRRSARNVTFQQTSSLFAHVYWASVAAVTRGGETWPVTQGCADTGPPAARQSGCASRRCRSGLSAATPRPAVTAAR